MRVSKAGDYWYVFEITMLIRGVRKKHVSRVVCMESIIYWSFGNSDALGGTCCLPRCPWRSMRHDEPCVLHRRRRVR